MLHDYTFKLMNPCSSGTGWILDYQLTKENNYPLTWYIATAAHVIDAWKFDEQNNIYKQKLPKSCIQDRTISPYLTIAKSDGKNRKIVSQQVVKNPRIFWTALDLFDKNPKFELENNNFKDFAVLEITFDSETTAKNMTNNFAEKYKSGPDSGINIFGKGLDPKQTKENNSYFYSLGYPTNKTDKFYLKNNWSEGKRGDTLSNDDANIFQIPKENKVRGFLPVNKPLLLSGRRQMDWGDKKYNKFGHFYYTEGFWSGRGSSGSMMVDENGDLMGVRVMAGMAYSLITPLRSEEVIQGEIKTPKYDLISGAENQKSSYKQQVEEHLLQHGKKTWLSSTRNWEYTKKARA